MIEAMWRALKVLENKKLRMDEHLIPIVVDDLRQAIEQAEKQEPVAWVRDLTSPQPHCVTSLKYLSIADTDAGVKYIPVYTAPKPEQWNPSDMAHRPNGLTNDDDVQEYKKPWFGLTDTEILNIIESDHGKFMIIKIAETKLRERNNG